MFTPMFLFAPAVVLVAVLTLNAFQNERVFWESSTSNEHALLAEQRAIKPYVTVVRHARDEAAPDTTARKRLLDEVTFKGLWQTETVRGAPLSKRRN